MTAEVLRKGDMFILRKSVVFDGECQRFGGGVCAI
jgi:hypothetical protein